MLINVQGLDLTPLASHLDLDHDLDLHLDLDHDHDYGLDLYLDLDHDHDHGLDLDLDRIFPMESLIKGVKKKMLENVLVFTHTGSIAAAGTPPRAHTTHIVASLGGGEQSQEEEESSEELHCGRWGWHWLSGQEGGRREGIGWRRRYRWTDFRYKNSDVKIHNCVK